MKILKLKEKSLALVAGIVIWVAGWLFIYFLDAHLDVANLGLLLVLTSAIASLWLSFNVSFFCSIVAIMAFNWSFITPRGTFTIDLQQDFILLLVTLLVNGIIAWLMNSLRNQTRQSQNYAATAQNLCSWVERLRDAEKPELLFPDFCRQLSELTQLHVALIVDGYEHGIKPNNEQQEALLHSWKTGQALGPETGRYHELNDTYMPLRGRQLLLGAVMLTGKIPQPLYIDVKNMCAQMALALEKSQIYLQQQVERDQAQAQKLKNTFLAAISHDYRTPLSTILSAASSIKQQDQNLNQQQRQMLITNIIEETEHLSRLTTNVLQLARLDATKNQLRANWESLEEIMGVVLRRIRKHDAFHRLQVKLMAQMPLIWGDALLLAQLFENLIDNALKYTVETPIDIKIHMEQEEFIFIIADQGPGISQDEIARLFDLFQRGDHHVSGTGVGLAFCKAVVEAHQGHFTVNSSSEGTTFECRISVRPQPSITV
jgi:two-component system, OmpR family, sensor histidine kinase KdpD